MAARFRDRIDDARALFGLQAMQFDLQGLVALFGHWKLFHVQLHSFKQKR